MAADRLSAERRVAKRPPQRSPHLGSRSNRVSGPWSDLARAPKGPPVLVYAFVHGLSHGGADRDDCRLRYSVGHGFLPLSDIWWLSVQINLPEHPAGVCEPDHILV